jgi:methionyl-tRNA formyltransferase
MLKKIVFMGTPLFAVPILKSLYQNGYQISAVYTQPPQKSQRGQKINKSPVQGISEILKIEHRTPGSLKNNKEEYNYLKELDADIAIVVAYGKLFQKNI